MVIRVGEIERSQACCWSAHGHVHMVPQKAESQATVDGNENENPHIWRDSDIALNCQTLSGRTILRDDRVSERHGVT